MISFIDYKTETKDEKKIKKNKNGFNLEKKKKKHLIYLYTRREKKIH